MFHSQQSSGEEFIIVELVTMMSCVTGDEPVSVVSSQRYVEWCSYYSATVVCESTLLLNIIDTINYSSSLAYCLRPDQLTVLITGRERCQQ